MIKQQQNHRHRMDSSLLHWVGSLTVLYWHQIFALDSFVIETQKVFSSHGGSLTFAMYHHRETI